MFIALALLTAGAWAFGSAIPPGAGVAGPPKVGFSVKFAVTPVPLRDMHVQPAPAGQKHEINPLQRIPFPNATTNGKVPDSIVQRTPGLTQPDPTGVNFEGVDANGPNPCGCAPPDTNGAVGSTQYVQWVNLAFSVFDKTTGAVITPTTPGNALFSALGGACAANNSGDPEAKYDQSAHQWVLMQPVFSAPYHFCFAVSQTDDATGLYNLYDFNVGSAEFPDYPHIGIWPDGYYVTVNEFSTGFDGEGVYAFDRVNMLAGNPAATFNYFHIPAMGGFLPGDWDGDGGAFGQPPPAGAPDTIATFNCTACNGTDGEVDTYLFHADYSAGGTPSLTGPTVTTTTPFALLACTLSGNRSCVPQPSPGEGLDAIGDRLMYRLPYRNYGSYESIVMNFTVDNGSGIGAPRWIELRDPEGTPTIFQEGTYSPDSNWRWMGSIAEDVSGDMALGYSKSSASLNPEIDITGRLNGDAPGTMGPELTLQAGGGVQENTADRWGDYSAMTVDPTDGCTFFFTSEYYQTNGSFQWSTRVGAYKYPSCTTGPTGTLEGTVTDSSTSLPIQGVSVHATAAGTNTDASGHYQFLLPVGSYNMTAAKYGYLPGSANGIAVTDGGDTIQDFTLTPAPMTQVVGSVTDGSGQGWPLYASVVITAPGAPTFTLYTDPTTGGYSVNLVSGTTYTFVVNSTGYQAGGGNVPVTGTTQEVDWALLVDATACTAPGYALDITGAYTDFSNANGTNPPPGWSVINTTPDTGQPWKFVTGPDPCSAFPGNDTGGTGVYAVVNSNCDGFVTDDTSLYSPVVDLSSLASASVTFNNEYIDCCGSAASVDVSTDGGATFTNGIWYYSGTSVPGPGQQNVDITPYISSTTQARFHFSGFWAWWWQVDNALVGFNGGCLPIPNAGLVVGNVYDANTGLALNGATVTGPNGSTTTVATPNDPNLDDGFYSLGASAGTGLSFTGSMNGYGNDNELANVTAGGVTHLNFNLPAGFINPNPNPLFDYLDPGSTTGNVTLNMDNTGSFDANWTISELNVPPIAGPSFPHGPFANPTLVKHALDRIPTNSRGMKDTMARDTRGFPAIAPARPEPAPLAAGNVVSSFPSNLAGPWGIGFNTLANPNDMWISNLTVLGGDNLDYRYLTDGTQTGDTMDTSPWVGVFPADMAFDARTGMIWQVDVPNGTSCIYEMDPVAKAYTGNKICPQFGTSERGLAYSPATDTFYSGSWNDGVINHFDQSGTILDSQYVGFAISGLAFNTSTGHLFVMTNSGHPNGGMNVYVLDVNNNYNLVGGFNITNNGTPVLPDYAGAGLEIGCTGHLWVVDQSGKNVYEAESGETGVCNFQDIPWLSENPTSGTSPAAGTFGVTATFDPTGLTPGLRQGQLVIRTDTPYPTILLPVDFIVRFLDVADNNAFARFIYGLAGANVTAGCGGNNYCGSGNVLRNQMAVFVIKARHGASYVPPSGTPQVYPDVPPGSFGYDFINQANAEGILFPGCTPAGNFCPTANMLRLPMAYALLEGEHGGGYTPPAANCGTFPFVDVTCPSPDADFVAQLVAEGITAGCDATHYCPTNSVVRSQMAVFLVTTFGLPHFP